MAGLFRKPARADGVIPRATRIEAAILGDESAGRPAKPESGADGFRRQRFSMTVLPAGHGTYSAAHHAAVVLHYGLTHCDHPALREVGHFRRMDLESLHGFRIGRSLHDDDSLLGYFVRALDLVLIPDYEQRRRLIRP
jgi:hypothetical protein